MEYLSDAQWEVTLDISVLEIDGGKGEMKKNVDRASACFQTGVEFSEKIIIESCLFFYENGFKWLYFSYEGLNIAVENLELSILDNERPPFCFMLALFIFGKPAIYCISL